MVTTSNGAKFAADVIVGADGIRSVVRQFVADVHVTPKAAGESAYRFLLRPEELQSINHPLLKDGRIPPVHHAVLGPQRKLILYPCRSGEVFNCIAFVREPAVFSFSLEVVLMTVQRIPSCMRLLQTNGC